MAGFRGIFDGSVQIDQAREERAHQAAMQQQQIRAQMQMQRQQIQAQMGMQQQQIQASAAQAEANRALNREQFGVTTGLATQELQLKQQQFAAEQPMRDMQIANAKLLLQKAQQDFDDDQAQRAALTAYRQSAFGSGVLSAMLNGVVPAKTLSNINQANGVADGDVGSIVGMGGGPDGAWYDIVAQDGQGNLAKTRQEVDPMAIMAIGHTILGKEGLKEFGAMYRTRDNNNTRMNLALEATMKAMMQDEMRQQREGANIDKKTEGALAVQESRNKGNLAVQDRRSAEKTLAGLSETLDGLDIQIAKAKKAKQPIPPELQQRRNDTDAAIQRITKDLAGTSAEGSAASQATAILQNGVITVTDPATGQTQQRPDTPAMREWLKAKGIVLQ